MPSETTNSSPENNAAANLACPCGSTQKNRIQSGFYVRGIEENYEYALYRCLKCQLVRSYPVPGVELYTEGYTHSTGDAGEYHDQEKFWTKLHADDIKIVLDRHPNTGKRVLDVGCNGGELVDALNKLGYEAEGCDVDPVALAYGERKFGVKLFNLDVSLHPLPAKYDCILLVHTLEHIVPLHPFLNNIADALVPGGLLYIRVPNYGGLLPSVMGQSWGFLMPQYHVWQFTPETLTHHVLQSNDGTKLRLGESTRNYTLEPASPGLKGAVKQIVTQVGEATNRSDEIRAVYVRL